MKKRNYYNDSDPKVCAWAQELINIGAIPDGFIDNRSIEYVQPEELEQYDQCHFFCGILGWAAAFVVSGFEHAVRIDSGSCPCQPFSSAGQKKGFDDKRHLWPHLFRITKVRRPVVLVGEQVSGKEALEWLDRVFADLEGEGYTCGAIDICAAGTGAQGHPVCQESAEFYRALAQRTDLSDELRRACALSAAAVDELIVGGPHIRNRLYWVAYLDGGRLSQRDAGQRTVSELGSFSPVGGLADSHDDGCTDDGCTEHEHEPRGCARGRAAEANASERCGACRVADDSVNGCDQAGRRCCASGSVGAVGDVLVGAVGDSPSVDQRSGKPRQCDCAECTFGGPSSRSCSVVQPDQPGLQGHSGHGDDRDQSGRIGAQPVGPVAETSSADRPCAGGLEHIALPTGERQPVVGNVLFGPSNAWGDFEIIPCLDGKARRAERGTFPLVARLPGDVVSGSDSSLPWEEVNNTHEGRKMRLFGYGNALCLPTACEFMDVLAEIFTELQK